VFTILVVRGNFSRWDMATLLLALDSSGNHFRHPKAEIYRAKAYRLEPLCSEGNARSQFVQIDITCIFCCPLITLPWCAIHAYVMHATPCNSFVHCLN
jgi:hypothetical protein